MSAVELPQLETSGTAWGPVLRTLLVCDLVDSTALVQRLGDQLASELMRKHDRVARALLTRHSGQEIDKTDGFLVLFERPIQAIGFALAYQRALRQLSEEETTELRARVGIHVGEVILWNNSAADIASGAKRVEVEGLVKPIAARLMHLALPGQVLVSGMAYSLSQRAQGELDHDMEAPRWRMHGHYDFKGVNQSVPVFEVGEALLAPFRAPPTGDKARRVLPWWRRPPFLIAEIFALILAIGVPVYLTMRSQPALAFGARDWVVIGDLRNLTGQTVFDASLDAALRLSLEQSRYVNIVSSLQVRDTLKRMNRAIDTTVDRGVGAEIALREGARALILPSIAEVGGRVRVVTEVIDPHTQTTVYANTADGIGMESVLGSVDNVAHELREKLGEALTSINNDSQPLPKVTTSNLDALRAYALAERAYIEGRIGETLELFDQAIKLDSKFALAYMGKARVHLGAEDRATALIELNQANTLRQHLAPRDALRLDAYLAMYGDPSAMLEKWKLYGTLYPDAYFAHINYADQASMYTNQYEDAIVETRKAIVEHNPGVGSAYYLLGHLYLAIEKYDDAFASLKQAQSLQAQRMGLVIVNAYAATRQFDQANRTFAEGRRSGVASNDLSRNITAISLPLDQGHWQDALAHASQYILTADSVGPLYGRLSRSTELSLLVLSETGGDYAKRLKPFLESEISLLHRVDVDHDVTLFNVLIAAYLAARSDNSDLSANAIKAVRDTARISGYPNVRNMLVIAQAELARNSGKSEDAINLLKAELKGTELYLTHVALRDAYVTASKYESALTESGWLAEHRGRAYEEYNNLEALQPLNIAESNLALLHKAELSSKLGRKEKSLEYMADFRKAWPNANQLAFLSQRINSLSPLGD
ncbi:putative peptide modification system cyclase [Pseudolysobacter antarcticus]|uniref:Putative peptide modification system cyclase n=1 Tax=Pseudolysobacter antarcticus TaxID=2511995 RepID=A0A411HEU2_9GAMM|nr:putative peptide modification system cyclase [Pseudolysobacter antarcticus]QBB69006.1 putative peptide modification system cyclase [Pseudolysobacter antarcticus]